MTTSPADILGVPRGPEVEEGGAGEVTVRNPPETLNTKALTSLTTTGEGGSGGVPVTVAGNEARSTENLIHLASLLEGPVVTSRKDGNRVLEVVKATKTIVNDSKEPGATE